MPTPPKKPDTKPAENPGFDFEKLNATMLGLGQAIQAQQKSLEALGNRMESLEQRPAQPPTPTPAEPKEFKINLGEEKDLETLSRMDFAGKMLEQINGLMEHNLKKISDTLEGKLSAVSDTIGRSSLEGEIKEMIGSKKDFMDWKEELKALRQELPNASLQRLYALVRSENPDKAKELDEKYADKPAAGEDGKAQGKAFGGFFPTNSHQEENTKMTQDEAVQKAWDDVFSGQNNLDTLFEGTDQP